MIAHLLECSVRAALMAAGTAVVLWLLRIRSAAAKHAAWTALLAVMLLLPGWTAWGPKAALPVLPAAGRDVLEPILPEGDVYQIPRRPAVSAIPVQRGGTSPVTPDPGAEWSWTGIVLGCYFAGTGVMMTRLIAGTVRARALVRRATADRCISRALAVPLR